MQLPAGHGLALALAPGNYFAESPASDEDDKNGNMAFKVHKMAVIHALLLSGHNEWMNERPQKKEEPYQKDAANRSAGVEAK